MPMRMFGWLTIFALSLAQADASPCAPPNPVAAYLNAHPHWAVLQINDLVADDRMLWHEYHEGFCPGIARVALDNTGMPSYALVLRDVRKKLEELVVLKAEAGKFREVVLEPPYAAEGTVVWRAPPGTTQDVYKGRKVRITHDSIIWERMEAAAQQIYFSGGKFHRIQTSD